MDTVGRLRERYPSAQYEVDVDRLDPGRPPGIGRGFYCGRAKRSTGQIVRTSGAEIEATAGAAADLACEAAGSPRTAGAAPQRLKAGHSPVAGSA